MASASAVEITSVTQLCEPRTAGRGVVVMLGRPSGRVLVHDVGCPFVTDEALHAQLTRRRGRKRPYVWMPGAMESITQFGAVPCRHPADPVAGQ